jgi:hypothetical protein
VSVRTIATLLAFAALMNGACSDSGGDDGDAPAGAGSGGASSGAGGSGGGTSAGAPATPSMETVGSFSVLLDVKQSATRISGVVRDGPAIPLVPFVPDEKSGDCQLFLPKPPFCDPVCSTDRVCAVGDVCIARPMNHSVGTVTIRGIATTSGANEFTMDPVGSSKAYGTSASVTLKYPPTEPGAAVSLSATGGDYAPFEIQTTGVGPIEGFSNEPLPLERGKPLMLEWTREPGAEVEVVLEIAHHGGQKGKIICNAQDTGSLVIPAALVTELIDLGVAGFPDVTLTRKSAGYTTIAPGRIELVVFSTTSREVSIPGLTSCMMDEDCPNNQRCGQNKACQ